MNQGFRYIILSLFICFSTVSYCQPTDSTKQNLEFFPPSFGKKKWKFLIGLDARRSYFAGEKVKINGLKVGMTYKGVHRFGTGFYWIAQDVVFNNISFGQADEAQNNETRFNLGYSSIFYERVILKTRWWEIAAPVHLGGGRIIGTYKDTIGTFQPYLEKPFSALVPSLQFKFYPWTWLPIKLTAGYRFTFNTDKEVKQMFNTFFCGFGIGLNPVQLYRAIFKSKKKDKKVNLQPADEIR